MTATRLGPAYRRLWSANVLSNLGGGMYGAAIPLLTAAITPQPALVAGAAAATELPWLFFGLPAGAIADRLDRRRLALVGTAVNSGIVAVVAIAVALDRAGLPLVYLAAVACGTCGTLTGTATMTLTPRLVDPHLLDRANSRMIAAGSASGELAGPAIGGYLFGIAAALPFLVNAGAGAIATALFCALPRRRPRPPDASGSTARTRRGAVREMAGDILAGTRWLLAHRRLRTITVLGVVFALTDTAWFALLVLYVRDILELPPEAYGVLLGIGAVGGLIGGLTAARIARAVGSIGPLLAGLLASAAVAQAVLAFTAVPALTAVSLATSSFAFGVWNVVTITLFQTLTPPDLLGRTVSADRTAIMAASPLGALLGGLAAESLGLRAPFVLGIPILLLGAIYGLFVLRHRSHPPDTGGAVVGGGPGPHQ